jgi:hypothetical protein
LVLDQTDALPQQRYYAFTFWNSGNQPWPADFGRDFCFEHEKYQYREQSMATSELPLGPASLQLVAESNGEKSSGNLGDLLDQVSKSSVGEVDGLIGELRQLRGKLQADGARIKRDIQEYETLSQQVMQLTKIISDSVASISKVPAISGRTH